MYKGKHCFFYAGAPGEPLATYAAHYGGDLGDGTSRVFVRLDDGSEVPVTGAQCDPATPTAGHWSEIPA
jgi:hypothetical protein